MSKLFWQFLKATPAVALSSAVFASGSAFAQTAPDEQAQTPSATELLEQVDQYNQQGNSLDQVTSVDQFSDVQPTDWAYEALRGLVERYGCIAGYPDGTYRGNRALTRYEFAAGLYSCLLQIERLIAASGSEVTQEDLAALERLVTEFEAELATLGTRVDNLEARLGEVEENQFSTTTKLNGEVIFAFVEPFGDEEIQQFALDEANPGEVVATDTFETDDVNSTFSNRVRLNFDASFYGEDRLRVRLESANVPNFGDELGTDAARLGFDGDNDNDIELNDLYYRFPVGGVVQGTIGASGMGIEDVFNVANPVFESSGTGTVTRFFRRNPAVYRTGNDGAGAAVSFGILGDATIDLAYLVDDDKINEPGGQTNGLFSGNFDYAAQLNISPFDNLDLALTYVYSYYERGIDTNLSGSTSSAIAQDPFGLLDFDFGDEDDEVTANRYGAQATFQFSDRFSVGGWYGWVDAEAQANGDEAEATVTNWAVHAALLDFGKEGSVLGAAFGQLPQVTDSEGLFPGAPDEDFEEDDSSYLAELQYRYPIGDNVLITPAVYAIFNANNNEDNDTVYVGVLRTTFKF
jgi:hypothetical protein